MKKLLFSLFALLVSMTATAQKEGDKIIVNMKDGQKKEIEFIGKTLEISSLKHENGKLGVYYKGWEDLGALDEFNIDNIQNVVFSIAKPANVDGVTLADGEANEDAKRLYKYLQLVYKSKTLSSVIADVNWNHKEADKIFNATGKYPAINCYDFIHVYVPDNNNWINYNDIKPVTEWADAGGIVSLMWHFNVPVNESTVPGSNGSGVTCTPSETTFKASNALVNGTWENKWFYEQMDKVANVILKLQDAGIAALWRPFHEAAGNATLKQQADWARAWFWWGYEGAETYKQLWKAMFNYFESKDIHNLIWVWTTQNYNGDSSKYNQDTDWYPGDEYVDIVGRDLYGETASANVREFQEIEAAYPGKMVTLAECGNDGSTTFCNIGDAWNGGAKWLWFMPWYGSNMPSNAWWSNAFSQSSVITRDQVNLNTSYVEQSAKDAVAGMGLGWNLGNTLDSWGTWIGNNQNPEKYETAWQQPVTTRELMHFMKQGGFNAIRIPVTWWQHLDSDDNIDAAWMNRVQEVADYVIDEGMYCILNVHHDTGSGNEEWLKADMDNFEKNNARYVKIWQQIATRFADYSHRLLFEGYNEMLDQDNTWNAPKSTTSYEAVNKFAQSFVNTVRGTGGNNGTRNLIVNTYAAAHGDAVLNNFTVPTDKVNGHLIVEVHSYDPYNWINKYGEWTSACSNELKSMFSRLNNRFVSKGIPVIIGEYGTNGEGDSVPTGSSSEKLKKAAADNAADMVKQAKALGIATFYWMALIDGKDRTDLKWTLPNVVDAMKKAYNE